LKDAYDARALLVSCAGLVRHDANLPEHCRQEAARLYTDKGRALLRSCLRVRGDTLKDRNVLARALAWDPNPARRDAGLAVELAREATEKGRGEAAYWNTLGLAHYSGGNWGEACAALERSMQLSKGGNGRDWFLLAMSCWQAGRQAEARGWYTRAVGWMAGRGRFDDELGRLRAAARALLNTPERRR
jgi:Flp pilus assembly protein TadD